MDRSVLTRYQGQVAVPLAVYAAAAALGMDMSSLPTSAYRIPGARGFAATELGVAMADGGAAEITPAQLAAHPAVQQLLADTAPPGRRGRGAGRQ
jgi:hypothetical protein